MTNIHRIADLVRGSYILPGETLSINELVGPRTVAGGFVRAGAIRQGHMVLEVGGGCIPVHHHHFQRGLFRGTRLRRVPQPFHLLLSLSIRAGGHSRDPGPRPDPEQHHRLPGAGLADVRQHIGDREDLLHQEHRRRRARPASLVGRGLHPRRDRSPAHLRETGAWWSTPSSPTTGRPRESTARDGPYPSPRADTARAQLLSAIPPDYRVIAVSHGVGHHQHQDEEHDGDHQAEQPWWEPAPLGFHGPLSPRPLPTQCRRRASIGGLDAS